MAEIHRLIREVGIEEARKRAAAGDKSDRLAVDLAYKMLLDTEGEIGITHAGFAMTALPHKRTENTLWKREGGIVKLLVETGRREDGSAIGIPYGAVARMMLLYLQTRAVQTKCREVELGGSMHAWMTRMDVGSGGTAYEAVREQARRISACRLTFLRKVSGSEFRSNGAFVRDSILPPDPRGQPSLWREAVYLDEKFYESLIQHPLPVREEAIKALSSRSMAIDVYVWLAYRLHELDKPTPIPWKKAHEQFGQGYAELRFFRRKMIECLKVVQSVYEEASIHVDDRKGITLYPSPPPAAPRPVAVGVPSKQTMPRLHLA